MTNTDKEAIKALAVELALSAEREVYAFLEGGETLWGVRSLPEFEDLEKFLNALDN